MSNANHSNDKNNSEKVVINLDFNDHNTLNVKKDNVDQSELKGVWQEYIKEQYRSLPRRNAYKKVIAQAGKWHCMSRKEVIQFNFQNATVEETKVPLSVSIDSPEDVPGVSIDTNSTERIVLDSIERVECAVCSGSGSYCSNCSDSGGISCTEQNCDGGIIKLDCDMCGYENKVSADCPQCNGSGYSLKQQCNKCNGTEQYYDPEKNRKVKCNVCDHGVYKEVCSNCSDGVSGEVKKECPNCSGTGQIRKGQCNMCSQYPETYKGKIPCNECSGGDESPECKECEGNGIVQHVSITRHTVDTSDIKEIKLTDVPKEADLNKSDLNPHLNYDTMIEEEFDTIKELQNNRNEAIAEHKSLPEDLTEGINETDILNIQYKYLISQSFTLYQYEHTENMKRLLDEAGGWLNKHTHYHHVKNDDSTVWVLFDEDENVVEPPYLDNLVYTNGLKRGLVNMSSAKPCSTLSRVEKSLLFFPASVIKIVRQPTEAVILGAGTLFVTGAVVPWLFYSLQVFPAEIRREVFEDMLSLPMIFVENYPVAFTGITILLFCSILLYEEY